MGWDRVKKALPAIAIIGTVAATLCYLDYRDAQRYARLAAAIEEMSIRWESKTDKVEARPAADTGEM